MQVATALVDLVRWRERQRILERSRVHGMVAIQISELMQGNVPSNCERPPAQRKAGKTQP